MVPLRCVRSRGAAKGLGKDPYVHIGFIFPIASKFSSKKMMPKLSVLLTKTKVSIECDANFKFRLKPDPETYN